LQIIESFSGRESIDYANVLGYYAAAKCRLGQCDEAIELSQLSLRIKSKRRVKNRLDQVFDLNTVALSWHNKGNRKEALMYYQSAL
jgi:hypothetical protein